MKRQFKTIGFAVLNVLQQIQTNYLDLMKYIYWREQI